jgi:L-ascorbate metabolism protein UlaG (beta-lactamase superfamily)
MLIFHHGHSEFLIELADGFRILTDPFDAHVGYPMHKVRCNAVTVSHAHSDHNEVSKAEGYTVLADHAGRIVLEPGVIATGIESWHDDRQGALRGPNCIFIIEAEGLRIAHLGDLGAWDESLAGRLTDLDILLIPVGGHYTIDAQSAAALCRRLQPRMVIPMHYRTNANADWPIAPVEDFLSAMNAINAPRMPLLRVTDRDLSEQPHIAVLTET